MTEPGALLTKLAYMIEHDACGDVWDINGVSEEDYAALPALLRSVAALRAPPAQGEPVVTPSDLVEVLENVRAGIEKIKQTKILSGGPGYIDASFVPIEIYKACHSLEHLTRGLRS